MRLLSDRFGSPVHLARRFTTSLRSTPPPATDDAWAQTHLLAGESALWLGMSGADRRHAVGTGRVAVSLLGASANRPVVAAALLHDVGKTDARLGTVGRAVVTAAALVAGPDRLASRVGGRAARYLEHSSRGAALLEAAGSDPLTVAWALEHHLRPDEWTVPPAVGAALKTADDE